MFMVLPNGFKLWAEATSAGTSGKSPPARLEYQLHMRLI